MKHTEGKWKKEGNKIQVFGSGTIAICPPPNDNGVFEFVANALLIAAAVNACIKLNPDNPMAVAESISELYEALRALVRLEVLPDYGTHDKTLGNTHSGRFEDAHKALAKAEGK